MRPSETTLHSSTGIRKDVERMQLEPWRENNGTSCRFDLDSGQYIRYNSILRIPKHSSYISQRFEYETSKAGLSKDYISKASNEVSHFATP